MTQWEMVGVVGRTTFEIPGQNFTVVVLTLDMASLAKSRQIFSLHGFTFQLSRPAVLGSPRLVVKVS